MNLAKPNQNITFKVGATNFELQRAIEAALPAAVAQTKDLAKKFKGSTEKETCSKIFNFLMSDITYKVDGDNQKIKLPSAFLRERSGDCKSYSLFTAAILSNLKIPFSFTYASYNPTDKTPEHIYVTTKNGCIIDAVYGKFNAEKKPCYKFQKTMNISYISGIKKHHSEKYEKREESYHNIGNIFKPNKDQSIFGTRYPGIGRTGIDWAKAVGQNITLAQANMYFGKNVTLAPARALLEAFIRNNGGGIASFLYSMWLRDTPYELPNQQKYADERLEFARQIEAKYKSKIFAFTNAENKLRQDAISDYLAKNPKAADDMASVYKLFPPTKFLTPARLEEKANINKSFAEKTAITKPLYDAFDKELEKKYPYNTRFLPLATSASKDQYRAIELKWFYDLGGSPDDLNVAVKEGNTRSPRGKDANYMLNKAFNGGLSIKDLPLVIRGLVSGWSGDKFGLGENGTYVFSINGTKGIGDPVTPEVIAAYSAVIIPILSFMGDEIRKYRAEEAAKNNTSNNSQNNGGQGGGGGTELLQGNTGIILLAAAGVGAYLYLKK